MITLISPAKTLDFDSPIPDTSATTPEFIEESHALIRKLRSLSKKKVSSLMNLNKSLTEENVMRYQEWEPEFTEANSRPAIFAFSGEVYRGLNVEQFNDAQLKFAQEHLRILSGLHGVLRPLDRIQPYRLEMGTKLPVRRKKNLYEFWGEHITQNLADQLKSMEEPVIINLASNEYSKAVDFDRLGARVITPVFKDFKNGEYKVIMTWAKHARGEMAGFIMRNQIDDPEQLKAFDHYVFNAELSTENEWIFLRG